MGVGSWTNWFARTCLVVMCGLGVTRDARAAEFDARGIMKLGGADVVFSESFEDAEILVNRGMRLYDRQGAELPSDVADIAEVLGIQDPPLEGRAAIFFARRQRTGVSNFSLDFPQLEGRVEITAWTRASPGVMMLTAIYAPLNQPLVSYFAGVTANPTGRRTSDDWVEVSTGPIDTNVLGMPLKGVFMNGKSGNNVLDALEVRRVGDALFPTLKECSIDTVEEDCGSQGDCLYGACVDSAAVWGAVPYTEAMRREYAMRVGHVFTRIHANRVAVSRRGTGFLTTMQGLARETSPRRFFGAVTRAVHEFRDHHTAPPMSMSAMQGSVRSTLGAEHSGALGACFGLTEMDLRGGALGFSVFRTDGQGGNTGVPLNVGDILIKIDNLPVTTWLTRHAWHAGQAPSDPASDLAWWSVELPGLVSTRARTLELLRCESATSCNTPERITVPINPTFRDRILEVGDMRAVVSPFQCDARFKDSVSEKAFPTSDYDVVTMEMVDGVPTFEFDGFSADDAWKNVFSNAFSTPQTRALFDTRLGNGGTVDAADHLVNLLRDQTSPRKAMAVVRPWHALDPDGFFDGMMMCIDAPPSPLFDECSGTVTFATWSATAPAANTKIAWLNTADVSANDFVPRMLKGRAGLRIFGPSPTSGAFGAIVMLAPLLPGEMYGGSLQMHDTRFGSTAQQLATTEYESGTGVAPDEVVVQKLSDSLAGRDTMLIRARAWLMEEP